MAVKDDLTGKKFGRLTVMQRADDIVLQSGRKKIAYICRCDCGAQKVAMAEQLRAGHVKSCGCIAKEMARNSVKSAGQIGIQKKKNRREALCGKRFGRITIIRAVGADKNGLFQAVCKCDCGKEFTATINNIKRGETTQCKECSLKQLHQIFAEKEMVDGTALCRLTQRMRSDNSTGVKGVYVNKRNGKYVAGIRLRGKKYWIGEYSSLEDARKARELAEEQLFDPILEEHGRKTTAECR